MFQIQKFISCNSVELAHFLNQIREKNWSLSSSAFLRKTKSVRSIKPQGLTKFHFKTDLQGIYLLKRNGKIVSCLQIDEKFKNQDVIIFSNVETEPNLQRKGVFWRVLGNNCLRRTCLSKYRRIELTTWSFNRKGIPLYKRVGFRAVPATNLLMENYLPSIVKHPDTQAYFDRYDYIRTLQNKRSYGYDAIEVNGLSVFEYYWKSRKSNDTLRVLVDWQKKEIVQVECKVVETPLLVEVKCDV
ncbi:MAG: GNAT family N-acetyltransferase [Candidatus Latescibacteria bacterium]|jgi:hypothetical protein|nr:GNAT family N-acetyltransferase [Candidatus Latescibacterota bacterium]